MSENLSSTHTHDGQCEVIDDPDCLRCMRKKLEATGVAVFFREGSSWRLGNYQAEKPNEAAEVDFICMLQQGIPEIIASYASGLILPDSRSAEQVFGPTGQLFETNSIIAAPVTKGNSNGVRLAWRDAAKPFSREDLRIIQCFGLCPEGCYSE